MKKIERASTLDRQYDVMTARTNNHGKGTDRVDEKARRRYVKSLKIRADAAIEDAGKSLGLAKEYQIMASDQGLMITANEISSIVKGAELALDEAKICLSKMGKNPRKAVAALDKINENARKIIRARADTFDALMEAKGEQARVRESDVDYARSATRSLFKLRLESDDVDEIYRRFGPSVVLALTGWINGLPAEIGYGRIMAEVEGAFKMVRHGVNDTLSDDEARVVIVAVQRQISPIPSIGLFKRTELIRAAYHVAKCFDPAHKRDAGRLERVKASS